MTSGIFFTWARPSGDEIEATYSVVRGEVCINAIRDVAGGSVELSDDERECLALDIAAERDLRDDEPDNARNLGLGNEGRII